MPEISVLVPVYEVEDYLPRCIDSIEEQSITDIEILLTDDGSPDGSGAICDAYSMADSRILVIHKYNGGLPSARNTAMQLMQGQAVTFVDSDDAIGPHWLAALREAMVAEDADMVYGDCTEISADGAILSQRTHSEGTVCISTPTEQIRFIFSHMLSNVGWEIWRRMYRSSRIRQNRLQVNELCGGFGEDMSFVLCYALFCRKVCAVECAEYYYRQRPGSIMQNGKGSMHLQSMNEVSKHIGQRILASGNTEWARYVPILHFLIMDNQYSRAGLCGFYRTIKSELPVIRDQEWYRQQTASLCHCRKTLVQLLGRRRAYRAWIMSDYFVHDGLLRRMLYGVLCVVWIWRHSLRTGGRQ